MNLPVSSLNTVEVQQVHTFVLDNTVVQHMSAFFKCQFKEKYCVGAIFSSRV